ncbi:6085_t:CDS:2, partial [Diversispora eburnea]
MLTKNNLVNIVNSINLDFTLITSFAILKLSNLLPNLEEISLRGCQRISLRGLGQDLSWSAYLKLKKLNVIWCKDMDPRLIFKQNVFNNFNGINYYKDILNIFKNSLPTKVELDIDVCERCEEHIKFWINCALCKLPKTFCMSCDLIHGCLDCFKFYCCISTSPQNSSSISLPLTSSQQTSSTASSQQTLTSSTSTAFPQNSSLTSSLSLQTKDLISSSPSISLITQPSELNSPSTSLSKSLNSIQLSTTTTSSTSTTTTFTTILLLTMENTITKKRKDKEEESPINIDKWKNNIDEHIYQPWMMNLSMLTSIKRED